MGDFDDERAGAALEKGQIDPPAGFGAEPRPPSGYREFKYPGWRFIVTNVLHNEHKLYL